MKIYYKNELTKSDPLPETMHSGDSKTLQISSVESHLKKVALVAPGYVQRILSQLNVPKNN